jgi:transposase
MLVPDQIEILLCTEAIDMRKGSNGLAGLVRDMLMEEPLARKLFVFQSKRRDQVTGEDFLLALQWICRLEQKNTSRQVQL